MMPFSSALATSEEVTLYEGQTETLYLPYSITSLNLKSVSFYSTSISNVQVVSYTNSSVKVKAVKSYSSPVIVRCDYHYYVGSGTYVYEATGAYDFIVTVEEFKLVPTSIKTPTIKAVTVGESVEIIPTVEPANAEYTLTWKIANTSIATVSDGIITGVSAGETDLKVSTDNGLYSMCRIVVTNPKPTGITLFPTEFSLEKGKYQWIDAQITPSNADYTLSWVSSNTDVATVTSKGRVDAVGVGNATITVTTNNGLSAMCSVTVTPGTYTFTLEREMATLGHISGLDFSNITGFKAYVASEYDESEGVVRFEQVQQVPGKTGLLIVGTPGTYNIPKEDVSLTIPQNYLQATWVQTIIYPYFDYDNTASYILTNGSHGIAFYAVSEEGYVPANKAFLKIPQSESLAKSFRIVFDETSDINNASSSTIENGVWYSINGMRLSHQPNKKGVYFYNMKKYIIK